MNHQVWEDHPVLSRHDLDQILFDLFGSFLLRQVQPV
jgi:hypothetical protein